MVLKQIQYSMMHAVMYTTNMLDWFEQVHDKKGPSFL